ncbi:hypothetical protein [Methanosarcina sp. Kolksee]|nr:hypothetical protein [Methanosarcina sp. Kolksee]
MKCKRLEKQLILKKVSKRFKEKYQVEDGVFGVNVKNGKCVFET